MTKCKLHYSLPVELPAFVARCILDCLAFRKAPTSVLLSGRPGTVLMLKELFALAQTAPDKSILSGFSCFHWLHRRVLRLLRPSSAKPITSSPCSVEMPESTYGETSSIPRSPSARCP